MQGYSCNYQKVVNAVVTLIMTVNDWNSNLAVLDAFKDAVAKSAKTTKDKVNIISVVAGQVSSGGGSRRLFGFGDGAAGETHVMMEIVDGVGAGLDRELGGHLRTAGVSAKGDVAWIEPHAVTVKSL